MSEAKEPTVENERDCVFMGRSHLVVLGAGASRAAFPNGDRHGKKLPLMADFVDTLELRPLLAQWGIDPDRNFEDVFSGIYEAGETDRIGILQSRVENYFGSLQIGDNPTIYDHLVLSLRKKDYIATFNWDPLLLQAYRRNGRFELPKLLFLHGNVGIGYCVKDRTVGVAGARCSKCLQSFTRAPLLYPISQKNYAANHFIASEWGTFKKLLAHTFMVTIFGYSGPQSDQEALSSMGAAWGPVRNRELEQTCFITIQDRDTVLGNFRDFVHTHHYEIDSNFYNSWIAHHPRRTGEAWWNQYLECMFLPNNPIPKDVDFPALWNFFEPFREPERLFEVTRGNRKNFGDA